MQEPSALGRIVELVRDLRARCPWDAAQTPQTLRPYLVEEVLELDHAIASSDAGAIRTELGDVLLHVAFQIVLAEEKGSFGAEDLTRAVEHKMHRRHPHLYGEPGAGNSEHAPGAGDVAREGPSLEKVTQSWERHKAAEREVDGSVLDGLPPMLPPLIMAYRLQERAAGVGFDWADANGPLEKVREETEELAADISTGAAPDRIEHELGDLLFAVVNLARKLGCDPRPALERANERFSDRFRQVEALATERGIDVNRAKLEVLDRLWEEVKRHKGE